MAEFVFIYIKSRILKIGFITIMDQDINVLECDNLIFL